jgi:hypothetical protein
VTQHGRQNLLRLLGTLIPSFLELLLHHHKLSTI